MLICLHFILLGYTNQILNIKTNNICKLCERVKERPWSHRVLAIFLSQLLNLLSQCLWYFATKFMWAQICLHSNKRNRKQPTEDLCQITFFPVIESLYINLSENNTLWRTFLTFIQQPRIIFSQFLFRTSMAYISNEYIILKKVWEFFL